MTPTPRMFRIAARQLLTFCGVCLFSASLCAAELNTLTGKKYQGSLSSFDGTVLYWQTAAGPIGIALKDLHTVELQAKPAPFDLKTVPDRIELTDGSFLRTSGIEIKGNEILPTLPYQKSKPFALRIPLSALSTFIRNYDDTKLRAEWAKLLSQRSKRDQLVIKSVDGLAPIPGTILSGSDTGDAIQFERESDSATVQYRLSRASGGLIVALRSRGEVPPTICRISDIFGNQWLAKSIVIAPKTLKIVTISDAAIEYPIELVAKLDFSLGNRSYISDMEAKVTSILDDDNDVMLTYTRDKTLDNSPLKLAGITYAKGLWIYPGTSLKYKLDGDFREFKATAGIDDSVTLASSEVIVTIRGDGRVLATYKINRKNPPKSFSLDVKNLKELQITVERTGLYLANELDLVDAQLLK